MTNTISHLQSEVWQHVNKQLVKKAISEFTHELILKPKAIKAIDEAWYLYEISSDNNVFTYQFEAKQCYLEHWVVNTESILKLDAEDNEQPINALYFITEFKTTLGIPDEFLGTYLEEITSTLSGAAFKCQHEKFTAKDLVEGTFQDIEHAMSEGHPCFVANNGRIGFNANDYQIYTPEANTDFKLLWIAAHKRYGTFTAVKNYDYNTFIQRELGDEKLHEFYSVLKDNNLAADDYLFMPVHPWQWTNKIIHVFASDIAINNIVLLGESDDYFSSQQSIRTLFNKTDSRKPYTKTALSILNMGFMRGLSPYYMQSTPHITTWIHNLLKDDTYLKANGFAMLDEVATVGYHNHYYETLGKTNPHNKMLSALWRESPFNKITPNQKVFTMAAFLHIDTNNNAFVAELIHASPYDTRTWLQRYLKAYLSPLIHCFYHYELVFMPHGENIIMVMEDHTPVHILMKDITEEVIVFNETMHLPEHADRLFTKTSDTMKILSIFTDVFDCFFRFLGAILEEQLKFSEDDFWRLVAECILDYQHAHPELAASYERYDVFVDEFDRCCLNRLQLGNTKQMLNLADPIDSLKLEGVLKNPIAKYKNIMALT